METILIPEEYHYLAPDGAEIRLLMDNAQGGVAHCTLKNNKISKAARHKTVNEIWHFLSGKGAIWRRNGNDELITPLEPGVTIDIPLGTDFQFRSDEGDLVFIIVTMPPWPGADEVIYVDQGAWEPSF